MLFYQVTILLKLTKSESENYNQVVEFMAS